MHWGADCFPRGVLKQGEDVAVRGKDQRGFLGKNLVVGLQRFEEAIELGSLRYLSVGASVNLRGLGVRFASDLLHLSVGVRLDFVEISVALTGDPRRFTVSFGTKALRDL